MIRIILGYADYFIVVLTGLILFSSFISIKWAFSVSIVELILGIIAGNLGLIQPEGWIVNIANMGGMFLTFLAGTEVNIKLVHKNLKTCLGIGIGSFLITFLVVFLIVYYTFRWSHNASLLTATALSVTSLSTVYGVVLSHGLARKNVGSVLIGATFIINSCTAFTLSILFMKEDIYSLIFVIASVIILIFAYKYSNKLFNSKKYGMQREELEIKYIFFLLMLLMYFSTLGRGQAMLPVFLLGAMLSEPFSRKNKNNVLGRLQIVVFSILTPVFYVISGTKVSLPIILSCLGMFVTLFAARQTSKFISAYAVIRKVFDKNQVYMTLILSAGLTFGLLAAFYGETNHLITTREYSLITGVLILSSIIPIAIGNKFYAPTQEDLYDDEKKLLAEDEQLKKEHS